MSADLQAHAAWLRVGRRTYWPDDILLKAWIPGERIVIGNFCSIANRVTILAGGERRTDTASLFPLDVPRSYRTTGETRIGNDVWIGTGATISGGVHVGDGAVIAAGAVVLDNVAPFAVVAGNPAKVLRYRFSRTVAERLRRIAWWDWPDDVIEPNLDWFYEPIDEFLERFDPGGGGGANDAAGSGPRQPD